MTDDALFKAILSMDAYNRGYNAGILFGNDPTNSTAINGVTQIGNATVYDSDGDQAAKNDGFYAIAYKDNTTGSITISYRGTDDPEGLVSGGDVINGWIIGAGQVIANQAGLAFDFYDSVAASLDPALHTNISLTGHSLGGGLAGLVAEVESLQGTLFDNMPFEAAALSAKAVAEAEYLAGDTDNKSLWRLAYGGSNPLDVSLNDSGNQTYFVIGEPLMAFRDFQSAPQTPLDLGNAALASDPIAQSVDEHDIALLTILLYAHDTPTVGNEWKYASPYFWPVMFDDGFASDTGINTTSVPGTLTTAGKDAQVMREMIAYSAIDDGTRIFGDTGIVALYHDANVLGTLLDPQNAQNVSQVIKDYATDISEVFVEFASDLALHKVLQSQHADVINGVIGLPGDGTLTVNFSDVVWKEALNTTDNPDMISRQDMFYDLIGDTQNPDATLFDVAYVWGGGYGVINRVIFALNEGGSYTISDNPDLSSASTVTAFVTGDNDTSVTLSHTGHDLVLLGAGDDTVLSNGPLSNVVVGGDGMNTVDYSSMTPTDAGELVGLIVYENDNPLSWTVEDWNGDIDQLLNIQHLVLPGSAGPVEDFVYLNAQFSDVRIIDGGGDDLISYAFSNSGNSANIYINWANTDDPGDYINILNTSPAAFGSIEGTTGHDVFHSNNIVGMTFDGNSGDNDTFIYAESGLTLTKYDFGTDFYATDNSGLTDTLRSFQTFMLNGSNSVADLEAPSNVTIVGDGNSTVVDYSNNFDFSGLTVAQSNGNLLVSDENGNTDTLTAIHQLILAPYDDTVNLSGPSGVNIDGGDYFNGNSFSYSADNLTVTKTDSNFVITDNSGNTDTLDNFQSFALTGNNDKLRLSATSDTIIAGNGTLTVDYSADSSSMYVYQSGIYTVVTDSTNVDLLTGTKNLILSGGDDTISLNAPSGLTVDGGNGNNTADYSADTSGVMITESGQNVLVTDGFGHTDTLTDIQNLILPDATNLITLNGPSGLTITGGSGINMVDYSADPHGLSILSSGYNTMVTDSSGKTDTLVNSHVVVGAGAVTVVTADTIYTSSYQISGNVDAISSNNQGSLLSILSLGHEYINNLGDAVDYSHIGAFLTMDISSNFTVTDGSTTDTYSGGLPNTIVGSEQGNNISVDVNTNVATLVYNPILGEYVVSDNLAIWTEGGNNAISLSGNIFSSSGFLDTTIVYAGGNVTVNEDAVNAESLAGLLPTHTDVPIGFYGPNIVLGPGITADEVSFHELNVTDLLVDFGGSLNTVYEFTLEIDIAGKGSITIPDVYKNVATFFDGSQELYGGGGFGQIRLWDGEDYNLLNYTIDGTVTSNLQNFYYNSVHTLSLNGQNFIFGTTSADDYTVSPGEGNSTVVDQGGANTIHVAGGDTIANITFTQVGNNLLVDYDDTVTIQNFFSSDPSVVSYKLAFDNGTTYDLTQLLTPTQNQPPVAQEDDFSGSKNNTVSGNVLEDNGHGADSDPNGDTLAVTAGTFSTAQGGSVVLNADGTFVYTPVHGLTGADTFNYTLLDGKGGTATGTVDLSLTNPPPVAQPDGFNVVTDQTLTGNLLADNGHGIDSDANGDALSVQAATFQTAHGIVDIHADGTFTYEAVAGYIGSDSFNYILTDGQDTASTTVSLTINAPAGAVVGTSGDDIINGTSSSNVILGLDGNDHVTGGGGIDHIYGGAGDDVINGNDGGDIITGGAGSDVIHGGAGNDIIVGGDAIIDYSSGNPVVTLVSTTGDGINNINGAGGNDIIYAGSGADTLNGGDGDDILHAGNGGDKLYGDTGIDILYGGSGTDVLNGNDGNDILHAGSGIATLNGGTGNDVLYAGSGTDTLLGGTGNDILYAGTGVTTMTGGDGADTFIFTALKAAADIVTDFKTSDSDKLDFSAFFTDAGTVQNSINDYIHATTVGSKTTVSVDVDGSANGSHFVDVVTLNNVHPFDVAAAVANGSLIV